MSAFFGGNSDSTASGGGTQAPAVAGTTTREQFAPQTGATTPQSTGGGSSGGGTGSGAAPQATSAAPTASAPATQAAAAPAFNSFSTWLGANQSSGQQEAQQATGSANSAASAANQATSGFTNYANSSASQGTDSGYVGSMPSASAPATPAPVSQAQADARLQAASSNPSATDSSQYGIGFTQSQETAQSQKGVGTSLAAGGANTTFSGASSAAVPGANTTSGGTVDLSNVNLAGYGGPSADQQQASQQGQALQAARAQANQQSQALQAAQSGAGAQNAWDSALLNSGDGRNAILNALQGTNMAGSNAGAAQQGAATAVGNAQNQSNAAVAQQKTDLGNALSSEAATASTNSANTASGAAAATSAFGSASTPAQEDAAIQQYKPYLQSLGLTPMQIEQMRSGVSDGALSPAALQATLSQAAAGNNTGYNAATAANTNSINSLLGTGAGTVSAGTQGSYDGAAAQQAQQNQAAINYAKNLGLQSDGMSLHGGAAMDVKSGNYSDMDNTVGYLSANGMTPQAIASALGLTGDDATNFANHYAGHTAGLGTTYSADAGANFDPNAASASTQFHY